MKIIRVIGSERNNSISTGMLNYVYQKTNIQNEFILKLGNFKGCIGCQKCKERKSLCVISDGMKAYFKALEEASILLVSGPNYMGDLSGQIKQFIDRHYSLSFVETLKVKKCYLFIGQGYEDLSFYQKSYDKVKSILERQLKAPVAYIVQSKKDWSKDEAFVECLDEIVEEIENEVLK